MSRVVVLTHPEVVIDPSVPVPLWGLSDVGRQRALSATSLVAGAHVFCSTETKAVETCAVLAAPAIQVAELGENDRASTGFLEPGEFEATADHFFAEPSVSVRGWETAAHAQARIVAAVSRCLDLAPAGDVAFVIHGAVGGLLLCHLLGVPISRAYDQPGAGSWWSFDRSTRAVLSTWAQVPLP